jgi:RNA recognition motif. (a.k.a. RRM, RBD, or RNP domain)
VVIMSSMGADYCESSVSSPLCQTAAIRDKDHLQDGAGDRVLRRKVLNSCIDHLETHAEDYITEPSMLVSDAPDIPRMVVSSEESVSVREPHQYHLHIKNLTADITEGELREVCSRLGGNVVNVVIQRDQSIVGGVCSALISLSSRVEATQLMMRLQGYWLRGREIKIRLHVPVTAAELRVTTTA